MQTKRLTERAPRAGCALSYNEEGQDADAPQRGDIHFSLRWCGRTLQRFRQGSFSRDHCTGRAIVLALLLLSQRRALEWLMAQVAAKKQSWKFHTESPRPQPLRRVVHENSPSLRLAPGAVLASGARGARSSPKAETQLPAVGSCARFPLICFRFPLSPVSGYTARPWKGVFQKRPNPGDQDSKAALLSPL